MKIIDIKHFGFLKRLQLAGRIVAASGIGYEAANTGRTRRSFGLSPGMMASADRHLTKHSLGRLRELCRMYDRQIPIFSGLLDRASENIIGHSFDFIPLVTGGDKTKDEDLVKRTKDYIWSRMEAEVCDAEGTRDFTEMAATALRSVWNDGDIALAKRPDGSMLAFEAEQIDSPGIANKRIALGVELSDVNRPVAYYIKQRKTVGDYGGLKSTSTQAERVPAEHVIFPAYRKRFSQTRGVPFLAVILSFFDRTNNYIDYESLAAEGNSMLGYQITADAGVEPVTPGTDVDMPGESDNPDTTSTFEKLQKMEAFQIFDLSETPGQKVSMVGAARPGSNFEPYVVMCLRIIGAGVGFPLEFFMMDFSRTNFSSGRMAMGVAKKMFKAWQYFGYRKFCNPWYSWQITRGIASGKLPADERLYNMRCQWPAWEYIDPLKEAMGNRVAIETNTKTVSGCIRDQGGEPEEVFEEREQEVRNAIKRAQQIKDETGVDVPWQAFCGLDSSKTPVTMNLSEKSDKEPNGEKDGTVED